jgi:hypothetical protein
MNDLVYKLARQASDLARQEVPDLREIPLFDRIRNEKFAQLIVAKVLDEVATRAYVSGDRAWSDDVDRQWIELEFGYGKLYDAKTFRS